MNISTKFRQSGLSITELMIAISISTVLLLGVGIVVQTSKATYRSQEAQANISENARFALYYLEQDIAAAGFWGCDSNESTGFLTEKNITNRLNAGGNNFINFDIGNGLAGVEGALGTPDSIIVQGLSGQPIQAIVDNAGRTLLTSRPVSLANETLLALSNCEELEIFQNTAQVTNATNIPHAAGPGINGPGNSASVFSSAKLGASTTPTASLYQANQVTYIIAPGAPPGAAPGTARNRPSLFRCVNINCAPGVTPALVAPLLEGVNNIQFTYGEDTNQDGVADRFVPAGTAGLNMANVVSVNVALTLDSHRINTISTGNQIASDTSGQRRLNRTIAKTFAVQNRIPLPCLNCP